MPRLTERQAAFCREILKGKSATQAARDAGYSDSYADRQALQLLEKPQVREYLDQLREQIEEADIADAEEVLHALTAILRGEGRRESSTKAGIIDLPPSFSESLRAADLLGKYHSLFVDRVDVTSDGKPIGVVGIEIVPRGPGEDDEDDPE